MSPQSETQSPVPSNPTFLVYITEGPNYLATTLLLVLNDKSGRYHKTYLLSTSKEAIEKYCISGNLTSSWPIPEILWRELKYYEQHGQIDDIPLASSHTRIMITNLIGHAKLQREAKHEKFRAELQKADEENDNVNKTFVTQLYNKWKEYDDWEEQKRYWNHYQSLLNTDLEHEDLTAGRKLVVDAAFIPEDGLIG